MPLTMVLQSTITPETFTLGDWLKIAELRENSPYWGFESWKESASPNVLSGLFLEDWEAIAEALDLSEAWAYHRYKEYRATKETLIK